MTIAVPTAPQFELQPYKSLSNDELQQRIDKSNLDLAIAVGDEVDFLCLRVIMFLGRLTGREAGFGEAEVHPAPGSPLDAVYVTRTAP